MSDEVVEGGLQSRQGWGVGDKVVERGSTKSWRVGGEVSEGRRRSRGRWGVVDKKDVEGGGGGVGVGRRSRGGWGLGDEVMGGGRQSRRGWATKSWRARPRRGTNHVLARI